MNSSFTIYTENTVPSNDFPRIVELPIVRDRESATRTPLAVVSQSRLNTMTRQQVAPFSPPRIVRFLPSGCSKFAPAQTPDYKKASATLRKFR